MAAVPLFAGNSVSVEILGKTLIFGTMSVLTLGSGACPTLVPSDTEYQMNFHTRKWVKPEDLNPNGTLFGGSLLRWIDEEAAIYAICQLDNQRVVTKFMSEINFVSSARQGDIIELGMTATHFGRTSITLRCEVRNKITRKSILTVEKMVFVNLDEKGEPAPHGRTQIRYADEAFARYQGASLPLQAAAGSDDEVGAARAEVESLH